jgi:hypothetical protein
MEQTGEVRPAAAPACLTAEAIAARLSEPNLVLIRRVLRVIGADRTMAVVEAALALEAEGGMLVKDGSRRRTPGGTFFALVRQGLSVRQRHLIFPWVMPPRPRESAPRRVTWAELQALVHNDTDSQTGSATTMKLSLVGRPVRPKIQGQVVIFQLQGTPPATLPKELPALPKHTPMVWVVVLGKRQWDKVKDSLARDPTDKLVLDGYPYMDGTRPILLVSGCVSVALQRATKAAQQAAAGQPSRPASG